VEDVEAVLTSPGQFGLIFIKLQIVSVAIDLLIQGEAREALCPITDEGNVR
jgi:hypothetical protein